MSVLTDISFAKKREAAQQVETQIVNKVEHVFYWGDLPKTKEFKVEVTGEFNDWKRESMFQSEGMNYGLRIPNTASHYLKKRLDPRKHTFHFVINNIDKLSTQYEKNIGQNTNYIDLKGAKTLMMIKKKSRPKPLQISSPTLPEIEEV